MKFSHCFVYQSFGNYFLFTGSGIDHTSGGDVVDLAWHATGIVMNDIFCLLLEDLGRTTGFGDATIDIWWCLHSWHRSHRQTQGDALNQIGLGRAFEGLA